MLFIVYRLPTEYLYALIEQYINIFNIKFKQACA